MYNTKSVLSPLVILTSILLNYFTNITANIQDLDKNTRQTKKILKSAEVKQANEKMLRNTTVTESQ